MSSFAGKSRRSSSIRVSVDAARANRYETICDLAAGLGDEHRRLKRRCEEHAEWVSSREGRRDLAGGLIRLELVMGAAWRQVLTPRLTSDGEAVAVGLIDALRAGAVMMWRTYADDMPDEAAVITVLALADLHAAAAQAGSPWTLMLDEFGAVIHMAAARGVAILQRGRSHHGQVMVISQSAADIEALSQQQGLLPSLSDNFTGFVAHRQTAPETRDWLAKLMGTRAIWQSTDQTRGHGAMHSGSGSRRRVREFRVGSDEFATLRRGEAVIFTTLGPEPERATILPARLPAAEPARMLAGVKHTAEMSVHPEETLAITVHHKQPPSVGEIDPHAVAAGSGRKVWWRCSTPGCGREWQAVVGDRTRGTLGCPACVYRRAGQKRARADRDQFLGALHPQLLDEWHPTRNGELDPFTIKPGSERRLWWRCSYCGDECKHRRCRADTAPAEAVRPAHSEWPVASS